MFFRASTIDKAKQLGVVGHVENTSRGSVTGEAQGEKQPVSQMKVSSCLEYSSRPLLCLIQLAVQDWLQNIGPSGAKIDKCNITNERDDLDKLSYSTFEKH